MHRNPATTTAEVIVVGAGLAGLTAATHLAEAGIDVRVLEASNRVGGKMKPGSLAGHPVDLGAQWIGGDHHRLRDLAAALGLSTEAQFIDGPVTYVAGPDHPRNGPLTHMDADVIDHAIAEAARVIDAAALAKRASGFSSPDRLRSASAWIDDNISSPVVREFMKADLRTVFSTDLDEISVACFFHVLLTGGGYLGITGIRHDQTQARTVKGGAFQIPQLLASALGSRVLLNHAVHAIATRDDSVMVSCERLVASARCAVVALPPNRLADVVFEPALPGPLAESFADYRLSAVIKFLVAYDRPFWRERGLSGTVLSTADGLVQAVNDKTLPDGRGALVGFFNGSNATRGSAMSQHERREEVIRFLVGALGEQAAQPIDYIDCDWSKEAFVRGGYSGLPQTGASVATSFIASPPIYFAASEFSAVKPGYMEGAIDSGSAAARAVVQTVRQGASVLGDA